MSKRTRSPARAPDRPDYMASFVQLRDICHDRFTRLAGEGRADAIFVALREAGAALWQSWPEPGPGDDPAGRVRAVYRLIAALGDAARYEASEAAADEARALDPDQLARKGVRLRNVIEGLEHAANLLRYHAADPGANPRAKPGRGPKADA